LVSLSFEELRLIKAEKFQLNVKNLTASNREINRLSANGDRLLLHGKDAG